LINIGKVSSTKRNDFQWWGYQNVANKVVKIPFLLLTSADDRLIFGAKNGSESVSENLGSDSICGEKELD
jgi:hypothetical protein